MAKCVSSPGGTCICFGVRLSFVARGEEPGRVDWRQTGLGHSSVEDHKLSGQEAGCLVPSTV